MADTNRNTSDLGDIERLREEAEWLTRRHPQEWGPAVALAPLLVINQRRIDPPLPREVVERVVREAYEREWHQSAEPAAPSRPEPTTTTELEITDDGLSEALRLAGWQLRWNARARRVEARHGEDDWQSCEGLQRSLLLNACSRVATMRRPSSVHAEPWRIASRNLQQELLEVVAARNVVNGEGTAVYDAVSEWARGESCGAAYTLGDVLTRVGALQRYESAARVPQHVYQDAKLALTDVGWAYKSVRIGGEPVKRWIASGRPSRKIVAISGDERRRVVAV